MILPQYDSLNQIHRHHLPNPPPCKNPDRHVIKDNKRRCITCAQSWLKSLPWDSHSFHNRHRSNSIDDALLVQLGLKESLIKRTATVRDYISHYGESWRGYTCEYFGVEIGMSEDPDSYPYSRLVIEGVDRNFIILLLRERICYEPKNAECPVFLEILFQGFDYEVSIKGLSPRLEIGFTDLNPILRVREFAFENLARTMKNPVLENKLQGFIMAAAKLGKNNERFSIPKLCKHYGQGKTAGYKSRDSYYSFLKVVGREEGSEMSERVAKRIHEAYEIAKTSRQDS